jgi:hypothetical protein
LELRLKKVHILSKIVIKKKESRSERKTEKRRQKQKV